MTRKKRIILLATLAILFLVTAPLVIFYSLGWRFDWDTKQFTQTGIFSFKVYPKGAEVYIDGEFKKKTDFFFGSALIENLTPKKYGVEIRKQGFHTWQKTLEIGKKNATEAKDIILIPKNPTFTTISRKIEEIFPGPNGKRIIFRELKNTESSESGIPSTDWSLKLFDLDQNIKSHLIDSNRFTLGENKQEVSLKDLEFSDDSERILVSLEKDGDKVDHYILEINDAPPVLVYLDFLEEEIRQIDFHPEENQKIFVLSSETNEKNQETITFQEINYINQDISTPISEDIIAFGSNNKYIYYLNKEGFIFENSLSFDKEDRLNSNPFEIKEDTNYQLSISDSSILLKENNTLYFFDRKESSFRKISDSIKDFEFASKENKIMYFTNNEIWISFLNSENEQTFITRFSGEINDVFWFTDQYLVFNIGDTIKIAETDNRDKINIVDFTEFEDPTIYWNTLNRRLYVLSQKNLHTSKEIAPQQK